MCAAPKMQSCQLTPNRPFTSNRIQPPTATRLLLGGEKCPCPPDLLGWVQRWVCSLDPITNVLEGGVLRGLCLGGAHRKSGRDQLAMAHRLDSISSGS